MRHGLLRLRPVWAGRQTAVSTSSRRLSSAASSRTYNDAIDLLNTLQTPYAIYQDRIRAGLRPDASSVAEMRDCLVRIGHSPRDLDRLNILHVAGTKGKGTTCAFADSILNQCRLARGVPAKVGLHTSPHLVSVRERLKINSVPVSEDLFARCFFEVWELLERHPSSLLPSPPAAAEPADEERRRLDPANWTAGSYAGRPIYGRFLTLMSWHLFLTEGVDVAVYETGIGGEYDATNLVARPCAAAVTSLGVDHVFHLGSTIEEIAWHKAGVFKPGVPAFTVPHEAFPAAEEVLRRRAAEVGVSSLRVVDADPRLDKVKVRPDALFQRRNAALAVALAEAALAQLGHPVLKGEEGDKSAENMESPPTVLSKEFVDGIEKVVWRGRCEVKHDGDVVWHLDGAHTLDSLVLAGSWFAKEVEQRSGPRILIFNQQGRAEATEFLTGLCRSTKTKDGRGFDHVIFCSNRTHSSTGFKRESINHTVNAVEVDKLTAQRAFAKEWSSLDPASSISVVGSIHEAIELVRKNAASMERSSPANHQAVPEAAAAQVLVTGSVHLVGGTLWVLEGAETL